MIGGMHTSDTGPDVLSPPGHRHPTYTQLAIEITDTVPALDDDPQHLVDDAVATAQRTAAEGHPQQRDALQLLADYEDWARRNGHRAWLSMPHFVMRFFRRDPVDPTVVRVAWDEAVVWLMQQYGPPMRRGRTPDGLILRAAARIAAGIRVSGSMLAYLPRELRRLPGIVAYGPAHPSGRYSRDQQG